MATTPTNPDKPAPSTGLLRTLGRSWSSLLVLALLILFPFLFSWLSGMPVNDGPPKFWQGQLIVVYIMAVFAMSYDLLIGYTGILTFGHAAFFGGGAYATALFLAHVAPGIAVRYRFVLPGGANITEQLLLAVALLSVARP